MRCPETLSHWRKPSRQRRRSSWMGNSEIGDGGEEGRQQMRLVDGTHARILLIQPLEGRHNRSISISLINSWCVRIFNPEFGVIAPLARIPPQDLRISTSSCSSRLSPPPPLIGTDMPDRRFCWNICVLNESVDDLMEGRVSKPECRNMDACLRRLKQELVCAVEYCIYM